MGQAGGNHSMGEAVIHQEGIDMDDTMQSLLTDAMETAVLLEIENRRLRELLNSSNDRTLIRDFWDCGDGTIISYAVMRSRLNQNECRTLRCLLDECMTQEEAAEALGVSTRCLQSWWYSATDKLMKLPWLMAYAKKIRSEKHGYRSD